MSQNKGARITNKQANVGSGAAGVGLGTALVLLAPSITSQPNIIEIIQLASPSVSIAGAFLFKFSYIYFEKKHRLGRISVATKRIDSLIQDKYLKPAAKSQLINKKEELHIEEIEILSGSIFNDIERTNLPNKSLKRTQ